MQIEGGLVGFIARCHDDRTRTHANAISIEIGMSSPRQQNTGAIIAGKHQRTFDRTGGEYHRPRTNLPQSLARLIHGRNGQMIGESLVEADEIVREITKRGGTRQQGHAAVLRERRDAALHPGERFLTIDHGAGVSEQAAAKLVRLIAQDDTGAALGRAQGRRNACGTCPDDQYVAMRIALRVSVGICMSGRAAQASGAAYHRFIQ